MRTDAGLDCGQAIAIIRSSFRQEIRSRRGRRGGASAFIGAFTLWLLYLFSGIFMGVTMTPSADPFTMGFIAATALFMLVGTFVAMEFTTIATGPEDLSFYSPLPVSPRTYVAAKICVACVFAVSFSACFGAPFALISALMGVNLGEIALHLLSQLLSSLSATLILITLLGIAVRRISYKRLRGAAAVVQLMVFLCIYGGYAVFQRYLHGLQSAVVPLTPLLLLAPSAWGASVFRLGGNWLAGAGFALSLAAPAVLLFTSVAVISRSYGEKIPDAAAHAPKAAKARSRKTLRTGGILWRSPEEQAVALLISNHFRHNPQFRMGILVIIPITLLYLAIIFFANRASLIDPFTTAGREGFPQTFLLYLAVGFFPFYVKSALSHSSESDARWLFLSSPADALKLVRAARTFITIFFLVPYLIALAAVFFAFTGALFNTIKHFLMISLLVLIETDVLLLFFPELPFCRPLQTGSRTARIFTRALSAFLFIVPVALLVYLVYPREFLYWPVLAGLACVTVVLRVTGARFAVLRLRKEEL